MAGELPSFDFGSESDNTKDEKGKKDTRKSSVSSALGNLIRPERQEAYPPPAVREREIGGLLFGERGAVESLSENKPKKKKKRATETPANPLSDRLDSISLTPQNPYVQPEATIPTALDSEAVSRMEDLLGNSSREKEQDYKTWAESAQEFELPEGAEYGGETIIYLHNNQSTPGYQPETNERGTEPTQEMDKEPIDARSASEAVFLPPTSLPNIESPTPVVSSPLEAVSAAPETHIVAPAGEPYAPVTELADDLPRVVPATEYINVNPTPGVNQAWNPAEAYRRGQNENAIRYGYQPPEQGATAKELDDAIYYATQSGQSRGVVAGLFAGGLYEHFKHRRRERKAERRFNEQSKQLEKAKEDSHFYFAEQTKQQAETNRRLEAAEGRSALAERQAYAYKEQGEQTAVQIAELQEDKKKREMAAQEIARQSVPGVVEDITIPREHVLQSSAWHSIEVDKRTGRPVETPTFAYGNEYYRERAHENQPGDQGSPAPGGATLTAAGTTGAGDQNGTIPGTSTPYIPSATTQGPPPNQKKIKGGMRGQRVPGSTGPLWPYLIALVVILFCLIALLN